MLRYPDEFERLKLIFDPEQFELKFILYLREKQAFLESYRQQLLKKKGRTPSTQFSSGLYVENDTWLIDYEGLVDAYAAAFGRDSMITIDYDQVMKRIGNVIPSFLEALDLELDQSVDLSQYYLNQRRE